MSPSNPKSQNFYDVLILGAGAAGLACAVALKKMGIHAHLLEARDRVGGRILSASELGQSVPLELGAEFVHGSSPISMRHLKEHGLAFYEVQEGHLVSTNNSLREAPQFFERIAQISGDLSKQTFKKRVDFSVDQFIKERRQERSSREMAFFKAYVEGFHASDAGKISAKSFAESETQGSGKGDMRLLSAYGDLPTKMAQSLEGDAIDFGVQVREVNWDSEMIRITSVSTQDGSEAIYQCSKLVVTLPLGVLKSIEAANGVKWLPSLPADKVRALGALEMGQVQRLVFRFSSAFWQKGLKPVSFLHASPDCHFPTWWTLAPLQTNYLIAWQGGAGAEKMRGWSMAMKVNAALNTLAKMLNRSVDSLSKKMESVFTHDWGEDPFSGGAYSYVKAGGVSAAKKLSAPLNGQVFFAGEACVSGEARGTVHGAIHSGELAAKRLHAAMGKSSAKKVA